MSIAIQVMVLLIFGYNCYRFLQLLLKMNQKALLPVSKEESIDLRKFPQKTVEPPTYANQKWGILLYTMLLSFMLVMFLLGLFRQFNWSYYLILLIPLFQSHNLFHLFAVLEEGILTGNRYIPWSRIRSYRFEPIDQNHRYYGYGKEVNSGYELILKGKFFSSSVIVTSELMKESLSKTLEKGLDRGKVSFK
jgi:hypothetical protein